MAPFGFALAFPFAFAFLFAISLPPKQKFRFGHFGSRILMLLVVSGQGIFEQAHGPLATTRLRGRYATYVLDHGSE
jgi:hypothetical protein